MVYAACPSVLALQLPDPRFSIDFNSYPLDASTSAISRKYMQDLFPGQNKPLPPQKPGVVYNRTLHPKPSRELQPKPSPLAVCTIPNAVTKYDQTSIECPIILDESPSSASDWSSASSNATMASSIASNTSHYPAKEARHVKRPRASLFGLPQTTVEQILGYVLTEEWAISITPHHSRTSPSNVRRQQWGLDAMDIQSIMLHPALLVSQRMRTLGLSVLYRKGLFFIDLCNTRHGLVSKEKDAEKRWGCWTDTATPRVVQEALTRALNVRFQLPVPSVEVAVVRGEKKRKTDSQDDPSTILECLQAIATLISGVSKQTPKEQARSASPAGPQTLRRKLSFRSAKRPDSLEFACRGDSPVTQPREPLKRLEVVLVKSSIDAEVHSQTLEIVATCSSIPVSKSLEYYLQLEGKRRLWAKRDMGKWQGCEPDGAKLVHDLRSLGRTPVKPQPAEKSDTSKNRAARPIAQTDRIHKEKVWYKQHLTGSKLHKEQRAQPFKDKLHKEQKVQPSNGKLQKEQKVQPLNGGIAAKKTKELEGKSKFRILKGTREPPTVQELQQIAADIKRGVY